MADHVKIFDTTLRDGEQSPGFALTSPQKVEMAHQLARLGVDVIEAGFPAASPDDFAAVRAGMMRLKFERLGCNARKMMPTSECWCYKAGPNGETWSTLGGGATLTDALEFAVASAPTETRWRVVGWTPVYGD